MDAGSALIQTSWRTTTPSGWCRRARSFRIYVRSARRRNRAPRHYADEMGAIVGVAVQIGNHAASRRRHALDRIRREVLRERRLHRLMAEHAARARARHRDAHAALGLG